MKNKIMKIATLEKALIKISFEVIGEITIKKNVTKRIINGGYIYTLYREYDNSIKIGHVKEINMKLNQIEKDGFILNNSRKGTLKEIEYLKGTLEDLGYVIDNNSNIFTLTNDLYKCLIKLNWPIAISYEKES